MQFIDLKKQYQLIENKIHQNIKAVLEHGQYIMGPEVKILEEKLAAFVGAKHCITVSSGTDALLIAMMALNIKAGDEVITTPFTFISTGETIALLGAKPIFVDIDARTYNLDPVLLEGAITPKTKLIMPVSLYGQCANFTEINAIANKYNIPVIEDAAQSFGAMQHGKRSCVLSTIGCTSFFPSKPLGGYGDGGACFTNDDQLARKMQMIRVHGQDRRYHHPVIGVNGRLDTLQAAILLVKLDIFPQEIILREKIGTEYSKLLAGVCQTPYLETGNTSVYAQYTLAVDHRDAFCEILKNHNIPTAVHYPIPLHKQPAFENLAIKDGQFPVSEKMAKRVVSLPMHPYLETQQIQFVVDAVKEALISVPA